MCPWTWPVFDFGLITEFRKTGRNPEGACMNVDSYIQTWDIRLSISFTFIWKPNKGFHHNRGHHEECMSKKQDGEKRKLELYQIGIE